jgi:DNA-binding response OmpR family regulator
MRHEVVCPRCKLHFAPQKGPADAAQDPRATVLLVEDQTYLREIAEESLRSKYEVRTASTMNEAQAILAGGGIDLMVLDLILDGGNQGLELLQTLTAKPCPILVYTAQDESETFGDTWQVLQNLGADDLVTKGMNVGDSLPRKVSALLGENWDEED